MSTLYLDRRDLALKLEGNALAVYAGEERRGTVPLHLLDTVVMHSAVALQSSLLARLADAGIGVVAFGGRFAGKIALVQGKGHNDGARRVGQYRRYEDPEWCRAWARRLVRGKLQRQQRLLRRAQAQRLDLRRPLCQALERLETARSRLRTEPALEVETLRGIEGAAAATYFGAFARLFAPALGFRARNRRPPKDPVNAVLSLGYTLLHYEAVRACHIAGLDPIIGFYHRLDFGRESLASDLIEPLRPAVDGWAWSRFRGRGLREEHFRHDGDACLLGKTGRAHFYAAWEPFVRPRRRLLRRFARHLAVELARDADAEPPPTAPPTEDAQT
jgi:CRISPR-associated protein Cas1